MKKLLFCIGLLIAGSNVSFAQSAHSISANRTEIIQDGNVIASYTRSETRAMDNKVTMVMTFIAKDGSTIATATIPYQQKDAKTKIITSKDSKEQSIVLTGKSDIDMAVEIANKLSAGKYL